MAQGRGSGDQRAPCRQPSLGCSLSILERVLIVPDCADPACPMVPCHRGTNRAGMSSRKFWQEGTLCVLHALRSHPGPSLWLCTRNYEQQCM